MMYVQAQQPITVTFTTDTLTVCRHDGLTYTGFNPVPDPASLYSALALQDLPIAAAPTVEPTSTAPTVEPLSTVPTVEPFDEQGLEPLNLLSPVNTTPDTPEVSLPDSPSSPETELGHESKRQRLTRELNATEGVTVPNVPEPTGRLRRQVKTIVDDITEAHNRTPRNSSLQVHLMYMLGKRISQQGREVRRCLPSILDRKRTRDRVLQTAKRVHRLVSRIGLGRVYAVPSLTLHSIQKMSNAEYEHFLEALRAEVVALSDTDSEGLVSEGGADVTPGL